MKLSAERIAAFVGGDLEIQNMVQNYLYRGPIKSVVIEDNELVIELEWLAINDGGPNQPTDTWSNSVNHSYKTKLCLGLFSEDAGRIIFRTQLGEIFILFSSHESKLDSARA